MVVIAAKAWTVLCATPCCRLEILGGAGGSAKIKDNKNLPHKCSLGQTHMLMTSAKGLLILLGFYLAFLSSCCYSLTPDSIKGLM